MSTLFIALQLAIALGIANVWLVRPAMATPYRGGSATTMKEEFAAYGLSESFMEGIRALKLLLAGALVIGIWVPELVQPAAAGMAALMLGAIAMHIKVKDPLQKSVPALCMLAMSIAVAVLQAS